MPFNNVVSRTDAAGDIPAVIGEQIAGAIEAESTALKLGRRLALSTKDSRIPVLTAVPEAYWITGDTGLKQTSEAAFTNQSVTAEELAVVVPVPDVVVQDSDFDLWGAIRPLVARAFASRLDRAILFGQQAPTSWGAGLVQRAATATQTVPTTTGSTADAAKDLLTAAELVARISRRSPTAAVVRPGWEFTASAQRTGALVANPVGAGSPFPLSVGGLPVATSPVMWDSTVATAIVADWQSVYVGVRQDIKFEVFNTGVIQDDTGVIVYNLLQQDMSAMRVTARFGYLLATPATVTGVAAVPVATVLP